MNDGSMIQLVVGSLGIAILAISIAFIAYWKMLAQKKCSLPQEPKPPKATPQREQTFEYAPMGAAQACQQ